MRNWPRRSTMRSTQPNSPPGKARSARRSHWPASQARRRRSRPLPEVAASEHVQERDQRDESENAPGELRHVTDIAPRQQIDPDQHDGDRVQETDQQLENLLHTSTLSA